MLAFQPIALTAMIAKWLDHHEHVRRSAVNTVNRYRTAIEHLRRFTEAEYPGLRTDRFDSGMAEQYVRHLRTAKVSPNDCNHRYLRKKSMLFTTNKPLNQWGRVLHEADLAEAITDRVLERGRLILVVDRLTGRGTSSAPRKRQRR